MAIGDTELWRNRTVTRGVLLKVVVCNNLTIALVIGVLFAYRSAQNAQIHRDIAQLETSKQQIQVQQNRLEMQQNQLMTEQKVQADLQIQGFKQMHDDFDKLIKLIVISDNAREGKRK